MSVNYIIYTKSISTSEYVRKIFYAYGFNYYWTTEVREDFDDSTILIRIFSETESRAESKSTRNSSTKYITKMDAVFSTNKHILMGYGINPIISDNTNGYLVSQNEIREAIPVALPYFAGLEGDDSWECFHLITIGKEGNLKPATLGKQSRNVYNLISGLNLTGLLDNAMLGPEHSDNDNWGDAYGENQLQSLSNINYIDLLLRTLFEKIQELIPYYLPLTIDHFPPGRTAPLIITGDTDSATNNEVQEFVEALNKKSQKSSLMFFGFSQYEPELLKKTVADGHSLGIHPYSEDGDARRYTNSFERLSSECGLYSDQISGIRNHYFQRINRTLTLEIAAKHGISFDLNCVASSERTWIGTGSGIGIPLPYPKLQKTVFQVPTIIEDDVFIYDLDYCYKSFQTGVLFSDDLCLYFLETWILKYNLPCVVNLHPEHIRHQHRSLFDRISDWAFSNNVWSPSLGEYGQWLNNRSQARIVLDKNIYVETQFPVVVKFINGKTTIMHNSNTLSHTGKHL